MRIHSLTSGSIASTRAVLMAAGCMALAGARAQSAASAINAVPPVQTKHADTRDSGTQPPRFEVASIKTHKPEGTMMRFGFHVTPDGISVSGVPLAALVSQAFGLPNDQILNEPEWARSARYDIEAKVDPSEASQLDRMTQKQRMAMLLPLLEDRFALKFHHETKAMNVYTLVVAKGGPKLKASTNNETAQSPSATRRGGPPPDSNPKGGPMSSQPDSPPGGAMPPPPPGARSGTPPPGAMMMQMSTQGMTIRGRGITSAQIADMIGRALGSTVVDKTGLTGKYDYTLNFAPETGGGMMAPMGPPPPSGAAASGAPASGASASNDSSASAPAPAPSIFTAVQEQLGLKLQVKKEPVDIIVIDHIEQPSPN